MNPRHKTLLIFLFIWIFASSIGIYQRLYTLRNNISHDVEEKATLLVLQNIRKSVNQQVERASSQRSPIEKQKFAKEQFDLIIRRDKQKVRDTIDQVIRQIQNSSPSDDTPFYLPEADSYYYYNLTENIVKTGRISEKIQGSKYFNALMNAPHGYWEPLNLHPYVGYAVAQIVTLFDQDASLMKAVSYTPLVLTALIILAYLFCTYLLNCGAWASLWGALFLICIPVFLRRSMFGWYKNDPANLFFLFLIPAVFFYGLKHLDRRRTTLTTAAICGGLLTLYSLFWQGWVFLASLIPLAGFGIVLFNILMKRNISLAKSSFQYFAVILGTAFLGVSLVFGPKEFFILFKEGWVALQDFINPQLSLWPDLYITVGELQSPTLQKWIEMMGGLVFIIIGVLGLVGRTVQMIRKPSDNINFSTIFLLLFWLIGLKLSLGAQRFATLCLIPFTLAFAIGAHYLLELIKTAFKTIPLVKTSRLAQFFIFALLTGLLAFFPFHSAQEKTPEILNKIYNSTWDAALTKIKNETPKDSIINTWWPPGHFIKAISQRRVTFDGATINKPQSYWIANALLETDERTAAGILRMLNISGNDATDYLQKQGLPLSQAITIIKSLVPLNEQQARRELIKKLTSDQIDHLVFLTHGKTPPPSYVLIYNDMAQDSLQFNFIGDWDFKKIEAINKDPSQKKNVPKRGSKDYINFLWKLAGGAPRYTTLFAPIMEKGETILFENNILINRESMTCTINSTKYGQGIPKSLFYEDNKEFLEKKLPQATLPISVILVTDSTGSRCMLAESKLARSMLLRLYYFQGKGLKIFEPFIDEKDTTGRTRIVVYRINWNEF